MLQVFLKLSSASITHKASWSRIAIGISVLLLAIWPSLSMRESLWIDELHSAWVISSDWGEIVHRAALGNQSPLYFYALKTWSELTAMLSPNAADDAMLRLSSLAGWVGLSSLIFITIRHTVPQHATLRTIVVVASWLWLDRIGAFYAIELRPYIWVAFGSLLVMLAGAKLAVQPGRFGFWWLLPSILVFYLHYTSIIAIVCSWLGIIIVLTMRWNTIDRHRRSRIVQLRAIEGIIFILLLIPGLWQLQGISRRTQQWAGFAGDASFVNAIDLLPWVFWTLVPFAALTIENALKILTAPKLEPEALADPGSKASTHSLERSASDSGSNRNQFSLGHAKPIFPILSPAIQNNAARVESGMWWQLILVGFGSLLVVWTMTSLELAPLMHRRYVLGAYPALILLGACLLGRMQSPRWLVVAGILSTTLMISWQGTLAEWQSGRWIAWQRLEDWRGAVACLNEHRRSEEPIFLAPMLIETKGSKIDSTIDGNYLRFPLTSLYRMENSDSICLLPNEQASWAAEINRLGGNSKDDIAWIVARIRSSAGLEAAFADSNPASTAGISWKIDHVFYGGGLRVWKLERR